MSNLINLGPLITKIARDMLEQEDKMLDVDSVYAKLEAEHGDAIFESAQLLATRSIKQSIKAHIKNAHSIGGEDERQGSLLKDEPAAVAVKQPDGGYGYIPLRAAGVDAIEAATQSKERNIANAKASYDRWTKFTQPILAIMKEQNVSFGVAQKIAGEQPAKPEKKVRERRA